MISESTPLIELLGAISGYGERTVLRSLDFHLGPGEVSGIFGLNGSGKSTLLKVLCGMVTLWSGTLRVRGIAMSSPTVRTLFQQGIVYVPPAGRIFELLTVRTNIQIAAGARRNWSSCIQRSCELFPELADRMDYEATVLSGGERQLLAIASAVAAQPKALLLDEPLVGLAPSLVPRILELIATLRAELGTACVLTDQTPDRLRPAVQASYLMDEGVLFRVKLVQDGENVRMEPAERA